ncbi:Rne/Rng family ribonuclease [Prochlorococcus marinus]|uniref:S1 RNA binding domain:Ribonuclease E and G n=1 Tax=Prochlorococcus marinus (strain MIT 9211) TaxID=93059 RepID=A9BCJ3_PROM4|nr:Rne/Rng family ribonuclease [Prochlorococcus marinus]ABX09555.1 S1 RNA binding domain:Ribonuclease E and G [Prochlorococcus marinus str. MIT 9211]
MPQKVVIAEQVRIAALLTDERVDELIVAQGHYQIGDIYLGTIENVLPGIDAAFVNIGASEKNGFIHVTDLGPLRLKKHAAGINELLEPRQKVLVQVMKEPTGSKGPRLTGNLALPGRYLILQPNGQGVNISRKINSENERNRLRALGVLIKPPGTGLLIRSEAKGINEELLITDLEALLKQWESIQQASEQSSPPVLLNREEDFINRILRDHVSPELTSVIVETPGGVERAKGFLGVDSNIIVESHDQPTNLLDHYKINKTIFESLKPRVELPSGGYIIIEPTEALTVIDVNSGSFTRSSNSRETVLWTNCEAAIEIARQLKLRNIGGVIIIDFIDMESRRDQLQLLEYFTSAIKNDSSRPQIAQLTELGLVELTRKRQGQNIYELFSKTCTTCNGLGHTAEIPGKEEIQTSATIGGLIQTEDSSKKILPSKEVISKAKNPDLAQESESSTLAINSEANNQESESESTNPRQEPELIAVNMSPDEEYVFSSLGLNPILLLETQPTNENLSVHVVRPGEDAKNILEEAKQQLSQNTNKRRRKTKNGASRSTKTTLENSLLVNNQEVITASEDEVLIDIAKEDTPNNMPENIGSVEELERVDDEKISPEGELDDSRRRRRRSSASN